MFVVIVNDTDGSTCQAVIDRVKGQLADITDVGKYSDLPTIQKVRYLTSLYNMGGWVKLRNKKSFFRLL